MTAVDPSGMAPVIHIPSPISWLCKFMPKLWGPELFMNNPQDATLRRGRGAIGRIQVL